MNKEYLQKLRHSAAHIMAQAVKDIFPDAKLAIGPAIEEGFYYDFDIEHRLTEEDFARIEARMREIVEGDFAFERKELSKKDALVFFNERGEGYKVELINDLDDEKISVWTHDGWTDLCKGSHIESTGKVKVFKLLSLAGAYWRGDEKNKMLQRIYGTAFETEDELKKHLELLEEAKKRDHRKLGAELDYFSMHEEIGPGLIIWHPKGALLRTIIEDYEKREHLKRGYQMVIGPHILKSDIWIKSGHYDYYKEHMFIFEIDGQEYGIKPMNCPAHIMVYKKRRRSYRELPIRYFELGNVYRYEKSGVLHGLLRVRGFTQDDAHIFCLKEQLVHEIESVLDFVIDVMKRFGFEEYEFELSTKPDKHIGSDEDWKDAEAALTKALEEKGISYKVHSKDGAFYGPKIDVRLKDALGRAWQCATVQCDFALPQRFDLKYTDKDGELKQPVMLHRVLLGSLERFIGALLEHYAGALPLWLSPVQAVIIPVTAAQNEYALKVKSALEADEIRADADLRDERLQYKIREAEVQKVPYMLIVGKREAEADKVSVRKRHKGDDGVMGVEEFSGKIEKEL